MRVEIATAVTDELADAFDRLVPQLSRSNPPPTRAHLEDIVGSAGTDLFAAYDAAGTIVGTSTLAVFRIPTGLRAWIEDVVVDEDARGQGVGEALTEAMLERARQLGCVTVDLTSRPSREAANRLYLRLGFTLRETNLYRIVIGNSPEHPG
ncbi:MAG: GNAT family N-acetyltransferase [Acidimicrobiales bacterium]